MKVTLIKDWKHPQGTLKKKGLELDVTDERKKSLEKGGYIEGPEKPLKEIETKKDKI